jgi:catechol 2,3-dioxygenase-like lactoylglutathione lyase family enzyme
MEPIIDHIHITINDLEKAEKYYDKLLPILGFDIKNKEKDEKPNYDYKIIEYHNKILSFGIVSPRKEFKHIKINRRRPGSLHHLAFRAKDKKDVDIIYEEIKRMDGEILIPPKYFPEYCEDYYAFFFKDIENIEYEIVYFNREKYFMD